MLILGFGYPKLHRIVFYNFCFFLYEFEACSLQIKPQALTASLQFTARYHYLLAVGQESHLLSPGLQWIGPDIHVCRFCNSPLRQVCPPTPSFIDEETLKAVVSEQEPRSSFSGGI